VRASPLGLGIRLQIPHDQLAVAILRRQGAYQPDAVARELRPLNRLPGIVDVMSNGLLVRDRPLLGVRADGADAEEQKNCDARILRSRRMRASLTERDYTLRENW
jgi:hypothetical protein